MFPNSFIAEALMARNIHVAHYVPSKKLNILDSMTVERS
ncbi:hypothetical protein X971_5058 (plasmid) [Agrobacterium tumefaciens LBA4213 (Ach5)]|nr:hypothetical protein X971_5058 [Agrobacterium tumefaciens LBA4213 (Ach5)]CUX06431.1 hypothetical protein AGR1C_pAt40422 [Agrobacterium fabacearum TT111]